MKITTNIRRSDLLNMNFWVMFNIKYSLKSLVIVGLIVFSFLALTEQPKNYEHFAITSIIVSLIILVFSFILSSVSVLLLSNSKAGVLGEHTYEITEKGIFEITPANETLIKWNGIASFHKHKKFIFIKINGYLYHIIPKRCFTNEDDYEIFWNEANHLFKKYA